MKLSGKPEAIVIREMAADDLARVHQLDTICFSAPWSLRNFQYELEDNQSSSQWVAEDQNGLIVGAVVTWLVVDEIHIATLSVDPDYRRHGIATRLVCTALRDGIQRGAVASTLEVRAGNTAAQRLYYKFGFQLVGRRPGYYHDNGEDALLLTLYDLDELHLKVIGCKD